MLNVEYLLDGVSMGELQRRMDLNIALGVQKQIVSNLGNSKMVLAFELPAGYTACFESSSSVGFRDHPYVLGS